MGIREKHGREFRVNGVLSINPVVLLVTMAFMWSFMIWMFAKPSDCMDLMWWWKRRITLAFLWLYYAIENVWLVFLVWLYFSKWSRTVLGSKDDSTPEFSDASWVIMMVCEIDCESMAMTRGIVRARVCPFVTLLPTVLDRDRDRPILSWGSRANISPSEQCEKFPERAINIWLQYCISRSDDAVVLSLRTARLDPVRPRCPYTGMGCALQRTSLCNEIR